MIYTSVLENYELDNQINCLMNEIMVYSESGPIYDTISKIIDKIAELIKTIYDKIKKFLTESKLKTALYMKLKREIHIPSKVVVYITGDFADEHNIVFEAAEYMLRHDSIDFDLDKIKEYSEKVDNAIDDIKHFQTKADFKYLEILDDKKKSEIIKFLTTDHLEKIIFKSINTIKKNINIIERDRKSLEEIAKSKNITDDEKEKCLAGAKLLSKITTYNVYNVNVYTQLKFVHVLNEDDKE